MNSKYQIVLNELSATEALLKEYTDNYARVTKELAQNEKKLVSLSNSRGVFENLLNISREDIQKKVCNVISKALQKILNMPNVFVDIVFEIKRNQPEAQIVIKVDDNTGGGRIDDSFGGGVEDVVSTITHIIVAHLLNIHGPLLADEPGKWIDEMGASKRFGEFLRQLRKTFSRQLIITTHKNELREIADNIIEVDYIEDHSRVTQE